MLGKILSHEQWMQANLFIGLGLLSTAYALKMGGWVALLGLAANAACFALAGEQG